MINVGYLDNIIYDYHHNKLTPQREFIEMIKPLQWADQAQAVKWYNKTREAGAGTAAHFKLCCIICSIIKKAAKTNNINLLEIQDAARWINFKS